MGQRGERSSTPMGGHNHGNVVPEFDGHVKLQEAHEWHWLPIQERGAHSRRSEMRRSAFVRHSALMLTVLGTVVAVFAWPPLPQPSAYHLFADQRSFLSIPALFVGVGLTT